MRPVQHSSNTGVLGAPPGWDHERQAVKGLPITRVVFDNGVPGVWSYWRPTDEERKAIAEGACIVLSVIGVTQPPVSLGVDGLDFEVF